MDSSTARMTDCSGLCLPGEGGDTVDLMRTLSALRCAGRADAVMGRALEGGGLAADPAKLVTRVRAALAALEPLDRAEVFDALPAAMDAPEETAFDDGTTDVRTLEERAMAMARYGIGAPACSGSTIVLPPAAEVYVPVYHALVRNTPFAVTGDEGSCRFTWPDGTALTLPHGRRAAHYDISHPHFVALPLLNGIPVLNAVPEIASSTEAFDLCPHAELPAAIARISEGFELLRSVWPAAYGAVMRHTKGIVVLAGRSYSRSHSPRRLQGAVMLTPEDAVTVGDLLVHETSHIRLNLFREFDPLMIDPEPERRHVSPWRQDARPLLGVVLGVHAFLNVCHYYRRLASNGERFARQREKVITGWKTAREVLRPTEAGTAFFEEMEREVMAL